MIASRDILRFALGNLARQRLRTLLTVTGVIVGTGAIVLMVSLGIGLQHQTVQMFNQVDFLTTIRVFPQKRSRSLMNFMRPLPGPVMKLDDASVAEFRRIPGVTTAYPFLNIFSRLQIEKDKPEGRKETMMGGTVEYVGLPQDGISPLYRNALWAGSFWQGEDPGERVAVVPVETLLEMGLVPRDAGPGHPAWKDVLGRTVRFQFSVTVRDEAPEGEETGEPPPDEKKEEEEEDEDAEITTKKVTRRFRIIGVYDSTNIGMPWAPALFVPLAQGVEIAKLRAARSSWVETGYQGVIVKVADASKTDEIRKGIDAQGYGTLLIQDIVEVIGYVFVMLQAVLGVVASIGLVVAFFGIANTMVMAILERRREIGVMKALGARNREIRRLFLVEAAAIGLLGAVAGIAGGWGMGQGMNAIARWFVKKEGGPEDLVLFVVSPELALGVAAFSVVVAALAGVYPAYRASKLDPVEALRSL